MMEVSLKILELVEVVEPLSVRLVVESSGTTKLQEN